MPSIDTSICNCRNKEDCPLNGQCQIGEVVYDSTLTGNHQNYKDKKYFGIADESFKTTPVQPQFIFQKWIL